MNRSLLLVLLFRSYKSKIWYDGDVPGVNFRFFSVLVSLISIQLISFFDLHIKIWYQLVFFLYFYCKKICGRFGKFKKLTQNRCIRMSENSIGSRFNFGKFRKNFFAIFWFEVLQWIIVEYSGRCFNRYLKHVFRSLVRLVMIPSRFV